MTTKTISQLEQVASITANDQVIVRDPEETTFAKTKYATITQISDFVVAAAADAGLQPSDGDLTTIAGLSGTGMAARTGSDAWSLRTLQAPAAGFSITNPAGTAGDPTFVLANDLAGLEGMSGTGFVARTASETYAQRTITAPAAGITVANGDGISGNPTLALANDLSAVEGLSATGIVRRTGSDTWSAGTTVATVEIADDAVTYAKLQNISATDRLVGRDTAGAGDAEEISVGGGVEFTGSGGIQRSALTGDVTASAGSNSTTIPNDTVTYAKIQNVSATDRILGRDTAGAGDIEELSVGGGLEFTGSAGIQRSALTGDVTASAGSNSTTIPNDTVTFAKMQDVATERILGRTTASSGDIEELTGAQAGSLIGLDDLADVDAPTPSDGYVLTWDDANSEWVAAEAPGAGTGAPSAAQYLVLATDAGLSGERVLVAGSALKSTDAGANGNFTLDLDITELTEDTTPAIADDLLVTYDDSGTANKKVKITNLPLNASKASTGTLPDARLSSAATPYGKQCVWIPATAMVARTTNGAGSGTVEMTTNKNMFKTLDFDASTQEFVQFSIGMPASWNESTVTFQPAWSHASTVTNFGAVFSLAGVALSDDDAGDVAFGTAQTSTDTGGTTNDIYIGPESSAITIAGTPAAGDLVMFQIARAPADGSDTLAVDARLHGIYLYITTDAGHD